MRSATSTVLDDYVNTPDSAYEFRDLGKSVRMDNYTVYYLNMTSQTWLSCTYACYVKVVCNSLYSL